MAIALTLLWAGLLQAQSTSVPLASRGGTPSPSSLGSTVPKEKAVPIRIARFDTRPVIDGRANDEVWKRATVLKDFYQIQPGDNSAPSKRTEVLLGYDSKYLYVAFRAFDDAGKVRATVAKRDAVSDDDNVSMYFDTFNDQRRAYELAFNPLGIQADAIFTEGGDENFSVDIVMESKGTLTDQGYEVEVAIPFKSLRYEAGNGKIWGMHFFRQIKRFNNERDSWMPISRDASGFLTQAGHLTGLEDISTERQVELIPSLTLSETGKRVRSISPAALQADPTLLDPGQFLNKPVGFDPGLTAKVGLSSTVTLDFALNPDFAQIEADQTVVTANLRFPINFPEKRPFFLERIEIFRTQLNAVNTRAIIDPDSAVKLSGKHGRNTFGLLLASDNGPGNYSDEERSDPVLLPRIRQFLDKNAYIGVLRLKRDIGKENSLGFIATSYNFIERHSQLAGFDGRFRLNPQTVVDFQILGTTSRQRFADPDRGNNFFRTGNGFAYFGRYERLARHFNFTLAGAGRTRYYRTAVGFTRRFNTNQYDMVTSYNSQPKPTARLISWTIADFSRTNFDWQHHMQNWSTNPTLTLNFRRQTSLTLGYNGGYERLFEEEFGPRRTPSRLGAFIGNDPERSHYTQNVSFSGSTTPSKKYSANLTTTYTWNAFDLDRGAGPRFPRVSPAALINPNALQDPGSGRELDIDGTFVYQPTNALRASIEYTKSRLFRNDTQRLAFDENIVALRATYQFSRFTFARARVDYDTLASNLRGQFLIGWTPNPGTAFYAGYNDDLTRNGFSQFTGQLEPGFRRNGRTFFIKMSYLIRHNF
jgi:hypothetical protein